MTSGCCMADMACLVQRLEVAVGRLESMSGPGGSGGQSAGGGAVSAYVEAFDEIISGSVAKYLSLSQKIGGDVQKHADMMKQAFCSQRNFLATASSSQRPAEGVMTALLQPVSKVIQQVQAFREANRSSKQFNHLSAVSESVPALGWVVTAPKPGPFVKEMLDAGTFYTNRVIKDYKETEPTHVDWARAYNAIWTDLQNYIKKHHTTGLVWSKTGPVASASAAPAAPAGGCPPPPPPGPPPPMMSAPSAPTASGDEDRNALFAALNQGSKITSALKHVSDDQKTHKNPTLRSTAPVRSGPKPFTTPKPAASCTTTCTLPPVFELEGKKWKVENQEGAQDLVINDTELKQVVYAYKCNKTTLQIKGKLNSIILDNCKKMGLVFEDVVGIVEVINCRDIKIQVMGKVPTISINKTDGCHVYLSKDSVSCEIVTAKSSEMNVLVPNKDGEFTELPVPEQFKTVWDGKKLVTTTAEIC
ncbi:adenylyl cyclase-associated protein 1 isoform X2 [Sebastes umbrosus]|uniref:adenylyl cyclase-associated protein 1 isoform X2 n=2 Tax=Sebastes umbrosus TaxID=72105 RepID=UPI00189FB93E|nr:adenylyl cyclase-associated protein 1 isoform X2 [Sebastes umbrosus]